MPYTQDYLRALLVRDPRFSFDNCTVTPGSIGQAGPAVDAFIPQPGNSGHTELEATGLSEADKKYEIYASREGFTIPGDASARFIWRPQIAGAGDDDYWRGSWPYPFISGSQVWAVKQSAQLKMLWPSMISTSDDFVHLAYMQKVQSSSTQSRVYYASLSPNTEQWSVPSAMPLNVQGAPALVELDGGQLLMFVLDSQSGTTMKRFWSSDRGVTWNEGGSFIGESSRGLMSRDFSLGLGGSLINFQVVHHNGYLTCIRTFQTPRSGVPAGDLGGYPVGTVQAVETDHYVSRDFGATWEFLERIQRFDPPEVGPVLRGTAAIDIGICPQIITDDSGTVFLIYTDDYDEPISGAPRFLKKAGPYGKFAEDPTYGTSDSLLGLPGGTAGSGGQNKSRQPLESSSNNGKIGHFVICKDRENKLMVLCNFGLDDKGSNPNHLSTGALFRYDFADPRYLLNDRSSHIRGWYDTADKGTTDTQWTLFDMFGNTGTGAGVISGYYALCKQSAAVAWKDKILVMMNTPSGQTGHGLQGGTLGGHCLVTLSGANGFDTFGGQSSLVHKEDQPREGFTYIPTESPLAYEAGVADVTKAIASGTGVSWSITKEGAKLVLVNDQCTIRHKGAGVHARVKATNNASFVGGAINGNCGVLTCMGIQLRFGKARAQVWDVSTGATQISDAVTLAEEERDWLILRNDVGFAAPAVTGFRAVVLYKKPSEQLWTRFPTYTDTPTSGIDNINQRLQADAEIGTTGVGPCAFGAGLAGGTDSVDAIYFQFVNIYGSGFGSLAGGAYNPRKTQHTGRALSLHPQYIDDGWLVSAQGGPTMFGDTWKAETRYEFGIDSAHPEISPSPRVEWRTVNDDSEVTITWNPQGSVKTKPTAAAWGVHMERINWGTCYLEVYDGSSWTTLETISTETDGAGLKYSLTGDTLSRNTADTSTHSAIRYYQIDELAGSYVVTDPGGASEKVHKIVANSEGGFYRTGAGETAPKETEIRIEPSASMPSATGTCTIRQNSVTQLVTNTDKWEQLRIRIPAQTTAEGYFKAGALIVGDLFVFGRDYSWGRQLTVEPNQEITTGRSGDRLVEELGPTRRRFEFSWTDGWDTTEISGDSPTSYTGVELATKIVAVREDSSVVEGVLTRAKGAKEPVVYLPRVYANGADIPEITGKTRHLYGRIVSKVTRQTLIGDEDKNEVHTINAVTIDEEI